MNRLIVAFLFFIAAPEVIGQIITQSTFFGSDVVPSDTTSEVTINYRTRNDLMIVPVVINNTIKVNLILDPRCNSVILFGKRYEKKLRKTREALLSESGKRRGDHARHRIAIGPATEENITISVVRNIDSFNFFTSVNGVIGYDLISKCDVTLNEKDQTMTLKLVKDSTIELTLLKNIRASENL